MIQKWIEKQWAILTIIILGINLVIRFIDQSQMINQFPFDFTNDISAYMAQLHFTKVCGFHGYCPYWYNGFTHLLINSPGWYFFAYPLYLFFNSVTAATYASMVLLYILGFFTTEILGRHLSLSPINRITFFMLFFTNVAVVGNTIRNGRLHAMLALVLFVLLFAMIWRYKDRKLDGWFAMLSIVYSLMLITHYQETILAGTLFLSLFLYKKSWNERLWIAISVGGAGVLASWWLIGFLRSLRMSSLLAFHEGKRVFEFSKEVLFTNIGTIVIPLIAVILLIMYLRKEPNKRERLFFLPQIVLGALYVTRTTTLIPILRNISQDPYLLFFLFFILIVTFKKIEGSKESKVIKVFIPILLLLAAVASTVMSTTLTPWYEQPTPLDKEIITMFPKIEERFVFVGNLQVEGLRSSYSKPLFAYASIYYNLSTADGWSPPLTSSDYLLRLDKALKEFSSGGSCIKFKEEMLFFNATSVVGVSETCKRLGSCEFKEKASSENVCLYRLLPETIFSAEKSNVPP